jgi:prepilin-type N-terminal cleavage/methylation domain-containing protein
MRAGKRAFTLIELLVVVGIIAVLISILLPSLGKAKRTVVTTNCLSNLRQVGTASNMYATDFNGLLPYPTTTLDEHYVWFDLVDPYLAAHANADRTGVAGDRSYMKYKQCPSLSYLFGGSTNYGGTGAQNTTTEYTRSYKMNSMLRRNNPYGPARMASVPTPSNFVAYGDGVAMDSTGTIPTQWENGQFSMEVNSASEASPALRHDGGACIDFVDGHAERVKLVTIDKHLRSPQDNIFVKSWRSEFVRNGSDYNLPAGSTSLPAGAGRNPAMPLIWSDPGNLYR